LKNRKAFIERAPSYSLYLWSIRGTCAGKMTKSSRMIKCGTALLFVALFMAFVAISSASGITQEQAYSGAIEDAKIAEESEFVIKKASEVIIASETNTSEFFGGSDFELIILHTNDVHAHIDDFDVDEHGNTCDVADKTEGKCFGGVARCKTMIDQIRTDSGNVVLLDAGDQFQGTPFYNLYKGAAAQEMMNRLGYDAMAVGNHEFDDGPSTLARFIDGAHFPVLSANINASAEPALAGKIQPYIILGVDGERIGVVGYTTEDTINISSPGPNVSFTTIEAILPSVIDELEAKGINKIIALSHAGFGRDCQVASTVSGLDVIVGGHSHTLLSNTDPDAEGPYPVVVNASDGNPVLVITDFSWGKNLGRLNVTFNATGVVTTYSGNPIVLDRSVVKDQEIRARVMELAEPLEELNAHVIGSTIVDLNATNCRFAECTMGNLITDAMLWKTQNGGTQIAIVQGGGIRASIPAGNVTTGDILTVLPFGNSISTFELSGAELVDTLEHGVSRADNPENEDTGRFPQVSGMRYTWSPTQPVGARIISTDICNPDGSYSSVDLNATYKVASTEFLRKGGDGYAVFVGARNAYDFGPLLSDAVQDYIAAYSPIAPQIEGRISQV
jgi:5'-nucleotidase/UDP-sugar diphosphatase